MSRVQSLPPYLLIACLPLALLARINYDLAICNAQVYETTAQSIKCTKKAM
jgi:hypothetical protein